MAFNRIIQMNHYFQKLFLSNCHEERKKHIPTRRHYHKKHNCNCNRVCNCCCNRVCNYNCNCNRVCNCCNCCCFDPFPSPTPPPPPPCNFTVNISGEPNICINVPTQITFTLSEPTTGFTSTDQITANGGFLSNFSSESLTIYKVIFTPDTLPITSVAVSAGSFSSSTTGCPNSASNDLIQNTNLSSNFTVTIAGGPNICINVPTTITFTLSEPTTEFTSTNQINAPDGFLSDFSSLSPTMYTVIFIPRIFGLTSISVSEGSFNSSTTACPNFASNVLILNSNDGPQILITGPSEISINTSTQIDFTLSSSSTNFQASDIEVTGGVLSGFTGSGEVYTALFTSDSNIGPKVITVPAGSFTDALGCPNRQDTFIFEAIEFS